MNEFMKWTGSLSLGGIMTGLVFLVAACAVEDATQGEYDQATRSEATVTIPAEYEDIFEEAIVANQMSNASQTQFDRSRVSGLLDLSLAKERSFGFATAPQSREQYAEIDANSIIRTVDQPVSTFSVDVDTGAYTNIRRFLNHGHLPPVDAVRVEEMINYFRYDYPVPESMDTPFSVHTDVAQTPWNSDTVLLKIGLKGYESPETDDRPAANLVFLLDVSGSMDSPDKLPLMISAMKILTQQLTQNDRVAIVVYAGASGLALPATPGNETAAIQRALDHLSAGGSTAGGAGLELAYRIADENLVDGGINRVILATDGDFNVGMTDREQIKDLIIGKREKGIALTTLGFGTGNYNEALMEQLADVGNGNYAYIDNAQEAQKVLGSQVAGTLFTIAKDVKIQIEFNPAVVAEYRLIGYENRVLAEQDFANDKVDAGDIGAGHTVTALYELALVGSEGVRMPNRRYDTPVPVGASEFKDELAFLKLRYKLPDEDESTLIAMALDADAAKNPPEISPDLAFASAVTAFGAMLRDSSYVEDFDYDEIVQLAEVGMSQATGPYRTQFVELVKLASALEESRQ